MKYVLIIGAMVLVLGVGGFIWFQNMFGIDNTADQTLPENREPVTQSDEPMELPEKIDDTKTVLGTSAGGNEITAYHYGNGETELVFIGGIHGGYSWNTALVAYELMDHLEDDSESLPENIKVTVIPVMNPDGLDEVVGTTGRFDADDVPSSEEETIPGRFNANGVDLNRNFECDWQKESKWQNRTVSGGDEAFSEPESRAVRDYIQSKDPQAVVVWYSAAGGVFASNCHSGVLPETGEITDVYADASGYKAYQEFGFYDITGDMVNWLARERVPAISVLLTTHDDVEWSKNRAGIEALLEHYSE